MVAIYLILSSIGAVFVLVIALRSEASTVEFADRIVVGGAFVASCVLGISLALRPGWIRRSSKVRSHAVIEDEQEPTERKMVGHHPDCTAFKDHVVQIGGRELCSGCTGLAIGSVTGMLLAVLYVAVPMETTQGILVALMFLGMVLIAFSYLDIAFSFGNARTHLAVNFLLVIGFYSVVISVHQLSGSIAFSLVSIIISFLWLDTRIQLSSWRHAETCKKCGEMCRIY